MNNPILILDIPTKFYGILREAVSYRIAAMQQLLDDPTTSEDELEQIAYGNDQPILASILTALNDPKHYINGECYQVYRNVTDNGQETTLQTLSAPPPIGHERVLTFIAKDFDEAAAINQQLLGFEPYVPMPTEIAIEQCYDFIDLNPLNNGMVHTLMTSIYQPQRYYRETRISVAVPTKEADTQRQQHWRCDYQIEGYGINLYQTEYGNDGLVVMMQVITAINQHLEQFQQDNPQLALVILDKN